MPPNDVDIAEITEITTNQNEMINNLLMEGWVLLGTSHGQDESGYPLSTCLLGRPRES